MRITSESIKVGHPDIVADVIAANIIAEILDEEQKMGVGLQNMPHCGLEVFLGRGLCLVGGEVTTRAKVDVERSVRKSVLDLGYGDTAVGLDGKTMKILNEIEADKTGTVTNILCANGQAVEYGQPMFEIA